MFADHEKNFVHWLESMLLWDYCETDYLVDRSRFSLSCGRPWPSNYQKYFHVTEDIPTQPPILAAIAATNETQDDSHGLRLQLHPVFCLMHRSAAAALKKFLCRWWIENARFFRHDQCCTHRVRSVRTLCEPQHIARPASVWKAYPAYRDQTKNNI